MSDISFGIAQNAIWLKDGDVVDNIFGAALVEPITIAHDGMYLGLPRGKLIDLADAKYPIMCATRVSEDGTVQESAYYDATGKRVYPIAAPAGGKVPIP